MSTTNSVQHAFSLIKEVTYGTTPATPVFLRKNVTGTTLALAKGVIETNTIRPDRQVNDVRGGNRQIGGDIGFELAYGAFDDLLEAVMCGTWTSNKLVPGVARRSYSILRNFTDIPDGADKPYHLYKGVEFNSMSLTIEPEAMVEGSFTVFGREVEFLTVAPAGTTYQQPSANKGIDSFTGNLKLDGTIVAVVTAVSLTIENGMEPRFVVFNDKTLSPKIGRTRVTGSLTMFMQNSAMLESFNLGTKKSLEFTLVDLGGNSLKFELPSIMGTGGQADVDGEADVNITYPFSTVFEDAALLPNVLQITRTVLSITVFFFGSVAPVFGRTDLFWA